MVLHCREPRSPGNFMFVCLQKDNAVTLQSSAVFIVLVIGKRDQHNEYS